jgi:hypothetical protein
MINVEKMKRPECLSLEKQKRESIKNSTYTQPNLILIREDGGPSNDDYIYIKEDRQ